MTRQEKAPTRQRRGGEVNRNRRSQYRPNLSPLESVVPLLTGVRKNGDGYRANCPNSVHERLKPSLALSEGREGQLLMNCFRCYDTRGILSSLGLEMADLFPDRPKDMTPEGRSEARAAFKRGAWMAALGVIVYEASLVFECGKWLRDERAPLSDGDMTRLKVACNRIHSAREVLQ